MSNALTIKLPENSIITQEKVSLLKEMICRGATDAELELFIVNCNRTGLDPFQKQCWAVKRWDSALGKEVMSFQTGVDGFRVIANRSDLYAGQLGPFWCGEDGVWQDVWLKSTPPVASKVGVLRADFKEPLWAVAKFHSYAAKKKDGSLTPFWLKMPDLMIAKVAECLALRKAFPQDLSSIYAPEEMQQANEKQITAAVENEIEAPPAIESPAVVKPTYKSAAKTITNFADQVILDLSNYEVRVGRYTGKRLGSIGTKDLERAVDYLNKSKETTPLQDAAQEFLIKATSFLDLMNANESDSNDAID